MSGPEVLDRACELAKEYRAGLSERRVGPNLSHAELRRRLDRPLEELGVSAVQVIEDLARDADPGLIANAGPRYFGFVIGGSLPVAVAADWLTAAWDQCASLYVVSPAASIVEQVAGRWLLDILRLPPDCGYAFVTGTQMATFTSLAAARHALLARRGWDVEAQGLFGAPRIRVVVSDETHVTIFKALRLLGLGASQVVRLGVDCEGRMNAASVRDALADHADPTIVCAQVGNVNSGCCDPIGEIAEITSSAEAWLHVDGAFGLWAAASPRLRDSVAGVEGADSWVTDAHKWLNVPYDSGIAIVRDPAALAASMSLGASYLLRAKGETRDAIDWGPELSRRARGFAVYATLRSLGRSGVADLVERCCDLATRMARRLASSASVEVLNEVVLNQVLVRFLPSSSDGDGDALTRAVIEEVQSEGTCWLGGTTWHGRHAMRIGISGWNTTESDIDRSVDAILHAVARRRS